MGHAVNANFHLTPKETVLVSFSYYTNGKFKNNLSAIAKNASTIPQQVRYINDAKMRFRVLSAGLKKYLKGTAVSEKTWNLYGTAGFGLLLGKIVNTHSLIVDTALYTLPVLSGEAHFKRLTFDLGFGWEQPIGGDFYFYTEARTIIPASDYPSKYLFVNRNAPFTGSIVAGLRILF